MPTPIVCLNERLRQFAAAFHACFSCPQMQYFVIVLLGLMLCQEQRTLTGLQRQVAQQSSLSGLSRFLAQAPWSADTLAATWLERFRQQMRRWSRRNASASGARDPSGAVVPPHPR